MRRVFAWATAFQFALCVAPMTAHAQRGSRACVGNAGKYPSREANAFSLTDENDAFHGHSDSAYTQGIRLAWDVGIFPAWLCGWFNVLSGAELLTLDSPSAGSLRFGIAQTMYTPSDLLNTALQPTSRPYAGYLSVSLAAIRATQTGSVITTELQGGEVGPSAAAQSTQSFAHWLNAWTRPRPEGWSHQLRSSKELSLRDAYTAPLIAACIHHCDGTPAELRYFDVMPDAEAIVGKPMTRFSAGATARLGFGFPAQPGIGRISVSLLEQIAKTRATPAAIPSAPGSDAEGGPATPGSIAPVEFPEITRSASLRDCWNSVALSVVKRVWFDVFFNVEDRYVASNQLITGGSNDQGADGWATLRQIDLEPHVDDYAGGFNLGVGNIVITYQRVARAAEIRLKEPAANGQTPRPHYFGSLSVMLMRNVAP